MMLEEFKKEIQQIEKRITVIQELTLTNSQLMKYNWVFLHPYSQVMDISIIKRLLDEDNPDEKILSFFGKKFFDLRGTIHFMDGLFKQRPFLKDFTPQIEESVVLCLQKDFRGAITVLIPVIEGVLRNFLIQEKGDSWRTNTSKKVFTECFSAMTEGIC